MTYRARFAAHDTLRCMIDVEMPGAVDYARIARQWFDAGFSVVGVEQRAALESGPKLPPEAIRRPMPSGPPGATWGFVSVTRYALKKVTKAGQQVFSPKESARVWSPRSWAWFLEQLTDPPHDATLGTAHLSGTGYPEDPRIRMTAVRDKQLPDWLRLAFSAPESCLDAPDRQRSWLAFIKETADSLNPAFGVIDYLYDSLYGQTAIESTVKPLNLMPWFDGLTMSRQVLRGYDWLTICPRELADRLGGRQALRRTGAFHEVAQLSGGGVWLLATADYRDYDEAAMDRVFRALAPVLPAGEPVLVDEKRAQQGRDYRIVYRDAATDSPP
ncbi:MAG: hypothetical protein JO345_28805 [Streptosporangiaceae bacterium]|nr:hypothetical protein [Streptosporangiaceae bacterium]